MFGHTVDFVVVFTAQGEDSRSRVDAKLEYPGKDGGREEVTSSAMIAVGRLNFSFVFEAYGDLKLSVAYGGEPFFEETIPLEE